MYAGMDREMINLIIVLFTLSTAVLALLLLMLMLVKDKLFPSRGGGRANASSANRQPINYQRMDGGKAINIDGLDYIDERNSAVIGGTVQISSLHQKNIGTTGS